MVQETNKPFQFATIPKQKQLSAIGNKKWDEVKQIDGIL